MKRDAEDLIIGQNIKRIRLEKGITQQALQEATQITIKSLSLIENGHTQIRRSNLKAVAKALGCSVSDLIQLPSTTTKESSKKHSPLQSHSLSKKELKLLHAFRSSSKLQQETVFELLRRFAKK
jgi:transcriptional regulator with XRE-family HTH domain